MCRPYTLYTCTQTASAVSTTGCVIILQLRACTYIYVNTCNGQAVIVRYYVKNAQKVNKQHDIVRRGRHVSVRIFFYGFVRLISEFRSGKTPTCVGYDCKPNSFSARKPTDYVTARRFWKQVWSFTSCDKKPGTSKQ